MGRGREGGGGRGGGRGRVGEEVFRASLFTTNYNKFSVII